MDSDTGLQRVSADTDPNEIVNIVNEYGGIVIKGVFTPDQVRRFNTELDPFLQKETPGSKTNNAFIKEFHGTNTKRVGNLVTRSKTFREEIIDNDVIHAISQAIFAKDSGAYWMSIAEVIEIGPGNPVQVLHRDFGNYPHYARLGQHGPEAMVNFLICMTEFTTENGATRVIPRSNQWKDYSDLGNQDMAVPVEMKAGDVLFFSGKVVHGGGANKTENFYRRAISFNMISSFLAPEEASTLIIDRGIVKTMSERAQRMIGFRSQYPTASSGLWKHEYLDVAGVLGL
ncbi:toxin biosynthesis protein [Cadophora sp. DSE1049]|nr:toxin biosynthesis protein [Cadophora sp. DSE1049]